MTNNINNNNNDPLSISSGADDDNNNNNNNDELQETPLEQRILEIVQSCPRNEAHQITVKPARLSAELGISIEDATAELCGLLAAVGGGHDGASFVFETTPSSTSSTSTALTMVFCFPPDFQQRAKANRRKEDFQQWCWATLRVAWKAVKILTAFGLILSLFILTIAAMIGIVAAIVAMSTNNNNGNNNSHQRGALIRQLRLLFYTIRQLLWCYALYGQHDETQDPFLSEMAYDMSLLMSICCVNPGSFFWWWRVQQLNRRRRYNRRGWGRSLWNTNSNSNSSNELETDVEGVRLVRRGEWGHQQQQQQQLQLTDAASDEQRGLLSIAVEYLFGPTPFQPGPTEAERWKLRGAAIAQLLLQEKSGGISLQQLSPYMDTPPANLDQDVATIVAGGLAIVSHFNGVPAATATGQPHLARFHFPELASESHFATTYYDGQPDEDETPSWTALLCLEGPPPRTTRRTGESTNRIPATLVERRHAFTKLQSDQFFKCVGLGTINLVGVLWFRSSLEPPNGMLQLREGTWLATVLQHGLVPVLYFYALLFFALPAGRLVLILALNRRRKQRNQRRKQLASALSVAASDGGTLQSGLL